MYPEKAAGYRNKPAWLDRAVAGEKRAQGGPVEDVDENRLKAYRDLNNAVQSDNSSNEGESGARRAARGRLSRDPFEAMASGAYSKRADGGRMEPLIDQRGRLSTDGDMNEPPTRMMQPSSPEAAQDARDTAADRTRRSVTSPRTPGPITKSLVAAGATPLVLGRLTADTIKVAADRINSPEAKEQIAGGVGQTMRRRGGRT